MKMIVIMAALALAGCGADGPPEPPAGATVAPVATITLGGSA